MDQTSQAVRPQPAWPEVPYKGLSYYTPLDVALFGGREADVRACARFIGGEDVRVLLVHGTTGCGKSSFLRAGLIPYLESEVARFQFLMSYDVGDAKSLFIRCTEAPLPQLAKTLWDWSESPFWIQPPDSELIKIPLIGVRGDFTDRREFVRKLGASVQDLIATLKVAGRLLPRTLVLIIDQGEEIITLCKDPMERRRFFDLLVAFSKTSINIKVIVALRKEYFSDFFEELSRRRYSSGNVSTFPLRELDREQLIQAITIPTSREIPAKYLQSRSQPGEHYNFVFEPGLPGRIVDALLDVSTRTSGGVLPMLQIVCERLYHAAKPSNQGAARIGRLLSSETWTIRQSHYEALGPLETQVEQYMNETIWREIDRQFPRFSAIERDEELALWKDLLFLEMLEVKSDGSAVTRIRDRGALATAAKMLKCRADFDQMLRFLAKPDNRILREDPLGDGSEPSARTISVAPMTSAGAAGIAQPRQDQISDQYSLGHDAIATVLTRWRPGREETLRRRETVARVFYITTRGMAVYLGIVAVVALFVMATGGDVAWPIPVIFTVAAFGTWFGAQLLAESAMQAVSRNPILRRYFWPRSV
jgi:hypothetical protein